MPNAIPVIDDSNYEHFIDPVVNGEVMLCRSMGMWNPDDGMEAAAGNFEDLQAKTGIELLTDDQIKERVRQQQLDHATQIELADDFGMKVLFQKSTPLCWSFSTARAGMHARLRETGQAVEFAPASLAAYVTGWRMRGGWGSASLDRLVSHGINYVSDWGNSQISFDRSLGTPENQQKASLNKCIEFYKLEDRNWQQHMSVIAQGFGVIADYGWWSHSVYTCGLTLELLLDFENSWSDTWGKNGRGQLAGNKRIADGAVVVLTMSPN